MSIKKVSSLVALALSLLVAPISGQEIPKNLGIPKRFENYQTEGYMLPFQNIYLDGSSFIVQPYSLSEFGEVAVEEVYQVLAFNRWGGVVITKHPLFYNFDLNGNGLFENEEVLIDKKRDGLNGNEEWAWITMMMKKNSSEI